MTIEALHRDVISAVSRGHIPVAVVDAIRDVIRAHVHAVAKSRLKDVIRALEVDGSRPDLVASLRAVLQKEEES